ncbi:Fic family protein [Aquimarina megaterium]|uniref:Fic family protein n=1 Tax=Aquimarina megaterium TaxID=1443666 RepID=UPI00046FAC10|nr:Fic family protein [Aquimarina megaterium]
MNNIKIATKLKSHLDSLRPLSKEDELRIMQKFRLDWNYHSNHLEGNSLTYGETKALILFGITAQGKPLKDHFEISGHDEAVKWILDIIKQDRPLTENFIRELHKVILKEPYEVDAITPDGSPTKRRIKIGQYKSSPNHVKTKTGEIFRFATPEETPALMRDLIDWYRNETNKSNFNPILVASEFHYKFIRIHPFDDGNGRTARILMNFILLQYGFPPVIIKTDDKLSYFSVLRQADTGVLEPFIDYIGKNLIHSLEIMIKGAKGESIEEPDDIDKEISLLEQRLKSFSQPIEISKNKDSILEIFDNSIVPLTNKFIEKAEKFEQFYVKNEFHLFVNNGSKTVSKESALEVARKSINEDTNSVRPNFVYTAFNQKGFQESNYHSSIEFQFDYAKYRVMASKNQVLIEKLYSEQLTDEEIIKLVNTEIKRHKNQIEKLIEKLRK